MRWFGYVAVIGVANAATCGLEHVTMMKIVHNNKEYAYVDADLEFIDAQNWCEGGYMNSVDFGFPFGQLLRPTTEELNFIRDNLIPDPSIEFHVGYKSTGSSDYETPAGYGIHYGHGVDAEKHWVEGEPKDYIGSIYSTNQYRVDEETGERIPLFASNSTQYSDNPPHRPFVCVRQLTEQFPPGLGGFGDPQECEKVVKKAYIETDNKEYAILAGVHTFEEARILCENSGDESYPNGEVVLNTIPINHVAEHLFDSSVLPWTGYTYDKCKDSYVSVYDSSIEVGPFDWNTNEPDVDNGECVVANLDHPTLGGPLETRPCDAKHEVVCQRQIVTYEVPKMQINGKEFTLMADKTYQADALSKCEARGATLIRPTTEELNLIQTLLPGNFTHWLGYSKDEITWVGNQPIHTPVTYGITDGKHGSDLSHWQANEPKCVGGIAVSTEVGVDASGTTFPLLTCTPNPEVVGYGPEKHYYVCVKDLISRPEEIEAENEAQSTETGVITIVGSLLIAFGVILMIGAIFYENFGRLQKSQNEEVEASL